jgi:hypothetical protein
LERLFLLIYFAIAQTQIDSSVSSILNSLTPLNTLILGALFWITIQTQSNFGILIIWQEVLC